MCALHARLNSFILNLNRENLNIEDEGPLLKHLSWYCSFSDVGVDNMRKEHAREREAQMQSCQSGSSAVLQGQNSANCYSNSDSLVDSSEFSVLRSVVLSE